MIDFSHITLPFTLPVIIVTILFLIFLVIPILFKKIHVPSIIGLIISGTVFGQYGLNLIPDDASIKLLGEIGIVFIMFLAGIELDFNQIKENKQKSVVFGFLTFAFPLTIGLIIYHFALGYSFLPAVLIALMFSTQTLVSYPIVSRLGLANNRSSVTAVGGTIITDTLVLLAVGILITAVKSEMTAEYFIYLAIAVALFIFLVAAVFPFIAKIFFKYMEDDNYAYFTLIIALLFLAGTLAHFVSLEPIIGAFLSGIALNRYIPKNSALMSNLQFAGNAIFIPCFLFYVGTLIDYSVVFNGYKTIEVTVILTVTALVAKFIPAVITGKIFNFTKNEIILLFGLSSSHAAAVIAILIVGYDIGIVDNSTLNATVLLVLLTCIVSSLVTERTGKKIVLTANMKIGEQDDGTEHIVVPYANPNNINKLLDLAVAGIEDRQSIIFPLTIVMENDKQYQKTININKKIIQDITNKLYSKEIIITPISRIDTNPIPGILRTIKELTATTLVIGWTGRQTKFETLGSNIDMILETTDLQTIVCHINESLSIFTNLTVVVPEHVEHEKGFKKWFAFIATVSKNIGCNVTFISKKTTGEMLQNHCQNWKLNQSANFIIMETFPEVMDFLAIPKKNTLMMFIFARDKSISFDTSMKDFIKYVSRIDVRRQNHSDYNFAILIPEQYSTGIEHDSIQGEISKF